jgi:hypothetical protein
MVTPGKRERRDRGSSIHRRTGSGKVSGIHMRNSYLHAVACLVSCSHASTLPVCSYCDSSFTQPAARGVGVCGYRGSMGVAISMATHAYSWIVRHASWQPVETEAFLRAVRNRINIIRVNDVLVLVKIV